MKKFFVCVAACLAVLGIFSELIVPHVISSTAESRLREITKSPTLDVSMKTTPGLLMLSGSVDAVKITAAEAMLGDVRANELNLVGEKVKIDTERLFSGGGFAITDAQKIDFSGKVTEASLKELIEKKVSKIEEATVSIASEKIEVQGKASLIGRKVRISLEGNLAHDGNRLMLHMTHLNIDKTRLGASFVSSLFGDVELVDFSRLNMPVHLSGVEQKDREVWLAFSN